MIRRFRRQPDDAGVTEPFFIGVVLLSFLMCGLVIDGGNALNAKADARRIAGEAARAGGQQIDPGQAITGEAFAVDPAAAAAAARAFLADQDVEGQVSVSDDGQTIAVTVTVTTTTYFAALVGQTSITTSADAEAQLLYEPTEN